MRLPSWLPSATLITALTLTPTACTSTGSVAPDVTPPADRFALPLCELDPGDQRPLSTRCQQFVDAEGRTVVLHGINARVEGLFDVTFDDGRVALEDIPEFTLADARRMRAMGFNLLRLPVNWSGIEPADTQPPTYDPTYLARLREVVDTCGEAGLFVLIDFHQDAYSKEIGEDGAPLWAISPEPNMLLEGPLTDLGARRGAGQTLAAFRTFFGDTEPGPTLRGRFASMAARVASDYVGDDTVIGYEIFNEPVAGDADTLRLNRDVGRAILAVDPGHLIVFEPQATFRVVFNRSGSVGAPFDVPGGVYAPHIYTLSFSGTEADLLAFTRASLRPANRSAYEEAVAWQTPLLVGEFGINPRGTRGLEYLELQLDLQDEFGASGAFWVWKEDSQGSWGLFDREGAAWIERDDLRAVLSRPMPERIAGQPLWWRYDRESRTLDIAYEGDPSVHDPTEVYIPGAADYTDAFSVRCDGRARDVERDPATGLVAVPCHGRGAHLVQVAPRP
ncbi:MAG: cellulase family glycosylhydrolase [Polyangiales bacterium]|nr:cellulase family glycosylhydrolase [Sandaracinaceae bacterium]